MLERAKFALPKSRLHEFREDMNELLDVSQGVDRQFRVVRRMQWAYSRWL